MPRLSIVIPVLGDPKKLDDTLVSILENRPSHCDIQVVHNEPYNDPYDLRNEVNFVEARRGASLGECLNLGVSLSNSPLIHVLACGVEVCPGWAHAALRRFHDPEVAAVAPVIVRSDDRDQVVSAGIGYGVEGTIWRLGHGKSWNDFATQCEDPNGPDILAGFYRKSALEAVGGFTSWKTSEFVGADLAMVLHQAKFRCAVEPECLAHLDVAIATSKPGFARGCDAEQFFWRWGSQNGWFGSLVGHIAMLTGECVTSPVRPRMIAQILGRTWGWMRAMSRKAPTTSYDAQGFPMILPGPYFDNEQDDTSSTARVA